MYQFTARVDIVVSSGRDSILALSDCLLDAPQLAEVAGAAGHGCAAAERP